MGRDDDTPPSRGRYRNPRGGAPIDVTPLPDPPIVHRPATPLPFTRLEAVPQELERGDITGRIDLGVRQAVATLPPPVARITGVDIAKIALGVLATLVSALVIALVTRGCRVIDDINDRPTRNEVREDIRRATEPLGAKLDALLERRP